VIVPACTDLIQKERGNLEVPEIRVWCHPHRIGKNGDDYYEVFKSFEEALKFIKLYRGAEEVPMLAFRGYELNIFGMKPE
jgi:hypothetical protein